MEKLIKVRVVSSKGHDEWEENSYTTLQKIKTEVEKNKKWLYIDNIETNIDNLTLDKLENAQYIILTNALAGG